MSTTRSSTKEAASASSTNTFPVGPSAKRELRRALVRSTNPAATIKAFQQDHSLHSMMARALGTTPSHAAASSKEDSAAPVESLDSDSVMTFLSHLGLTQHEVHKRISDALLKELEDEIRRHRTTDNDDAPLLDLLKSSWAYATTIPELRPVLWAILKQLGERTPAAVLQALTERASRKKADAAKLKHADIFRPLTPLLKRLCWEADWASRIPTKLLEPRTFLESHVESTLLYLTLQPLLQEYCTSPALQQAADLPFVATLRERKLLTTQRRALTSSSSTASAAAATTTGAAASLRNKLGAKTTTDTKPAVSATKPTTAPSSGKAIAQLRSLLSDPVGSALHYRPKLLFALLSILMAQHGALLEENNSSASLFLGGRHHLHCTLTADILLSAGGSLPTAYSHVLQLARVLDESVQAGQVTDEALQQLLTTLQKIFQPADEPLFDTEGTDNETTQKAAASSPKKKSKQANNKDDNDDNDDTTAPAITAASATPAMKRQLNRLITAGLQAMKDADPQNLFGNPVTDKIAPGYSKIISKPMCRHSMEQTVATADGYDSLEAWQADVKLMFQNCIDYNKGKAGQWFRGEAKRQLKVFNSEIYAQAKKLYQKEVAKKQQKAVVESSRKRPAAEMENANNATAAAAATTMIRPLPPSNKKRKKSEQQAAASSTKKKGGKDQQQQATNEPVPSMPALASMLLADPFVVRLLLARILRDLQRQVGPQSSSKSSASSTLPVHHAAIPAVLQLLHVAQQSRHLCASRGQWYHVPASGMTAPPPPSTDNSQDPSLFVVLHVLPYVSLRQMIPQILRLLLQEQLDRRIVPTTGDLYLAAQAKPELQPVAIASTAWKYEYNSLKNQNDGEKEAPTVLPVVVVALLQGAMVSLCQPGQENEASLAMSYPKFAQALQSLSSVSSSSNRLWNDRVFFLCLIRALVKHKSKLSKETRDAVVSSWLAWLQQQQQPSSEENDNNGDDDDNSNKEGAMTTAAHECLIRLLNEWSALGNLLLTRDKLVEFATETVAAVNASESSEDRQFAALWHATTNEQDADGDDNDENHKALFRPIRQQYERMLKHLPAARAQEWKEQVGIATTTTTTTAASTTATTTAATTAAATTADDDDAHQQEEEEEHDDATGNDDDGEHAAATDNIDMEL